jgi:hypothetical protein
MSVHTAADENLDIIKKDIDEALEKLLPIVMGTIWGAEEFKVSYLFKISDAFTQLMEVRAKIHNR